MLRGLGCIHQQHNPWLVALALGICTLAGFATFSLLTRGLDASAADGSKGGRIPALLAGRMGAAWRAAAALAFGGGVWATHFVGMLAYLPARGAAYSLPITLASLALPMLGGWLGFALLARAPRRRATQAGAGMTLGLSVAAMHFTGVLALRDGFALSFEAGCVAVAIALGCAGAVLALMAGSRMWGLLKTFWLVLGVCALHFAGMAALTLSPAPAPGAAASGLDPQPMAIAVTAVTLLILALSLTAAAYDRHTASSSAREAERLRGLLDATFEGILFARDGIVTEVNAPLCRLLDRERGWLLGRPVAEALGADRLPTASQDGARAAMEVDLLDARGQRRPVELLARSMAGWGSGLSVLAVRDIGEQRRAERRIAYLHHHDALTGLANRALFLDRIAQALPHAQRGLAAGAGAGAALALLDLDGFKAVNDALGHVAGDALLVEAARRLSGSVRDTDTVARLSGDEFAVLLPQIEQPQQVVALAERLLRQMAEPFELATAANPGVAPVPIGCSIGIALYPDDAAAEEDLLRAAGLALHRARQEGKGLYRFFEPDMDSRLRQRRVMEQDLRHAVQHGQLELHYQPQFDCATLELTGYEALLRWTHPRHGRVSPAEFVPIAEESGLILDIGQWVLATACAEAASWPQPHRIAVNLSPAQFKQPDLTDAVLGVLASTGLTPARLELEVTEGVLIDDADRALELLRALKAHGMRIALDDFGTGYSSLSYLRRFPFDVLKIDKSFVQALGADGGADAIVRMVIALGHSLSLDVTAEGVETQEQLEQLRALNCGHVQGFLLGRPMPVAELRRAREAAKAPARA